MVRVEADLMLSSLRDLHLTYVELGSSKVGLEVIISLFNQVSDVINQGSVNQAAQAPLQPSHLSVVSFCLGRVKDLGPSLARCPALETISTYKLLGLGGYGRYNDIDSNDL
jgi:hypothetical protein